MFSLSASQFMRSIASNARMRLIWLAASIVLIRSELARAEVYKCVGADGTTTYSDNACAPQPKQPEVKSTVDAPSSLGAARNVPVVPENSATAGSSLESKLRELILRTNLSARESPDPTEIAQAMVLRVEPNLANAPHDPRAALLSSVIQADIRGDMTTLGRAFAESDQILVRALKSQIHEGDVDSMLTFMHSPVGVSYLQFLGDMRSIYATAVRSVLGHVALQTTISQSKASAPVTQMRLRLIALATGAADLSRAQDIAHNQHDASPYAADGLLPEQIAAVAGPDIDAVAARYKTALDEFEAFNASAPTRRFFKAVGPPVALKIAATDAAMGDFSDAELQQYGARWKVAYQRGANYMTVLSGPNLAASGLVPQIRRATYASARSRALDVTGAMQTACGFGNGGCKLVCSSQLGGDPDFGRAKYCQITFQCGSQPTRNLTLQEGRSLTLACGP